MQSHAERAHGAVIPVKADKKEKSAAAQGKKNISTVGLATSSASLSSIALESTQAFHPILESAANALFSTDLKPNHQSVFINDDSATTSSLQGLTHGADVLDFADDDSSDSEGVIADVIIVFRIKRHAFVFLKALNALLVPIVRLEHKRSTIFSRVTSIQQSN